MLGKNREKNFASAIPNKISDGTSYNCGYRHCPSNQTQEEIIKLQPSQRLKKLMHLLKFEAIVDSCLV